MKEEPTTGERRLAPRFATRSLVELRLPDWSALRAVYTVNLSIGGMRLSVGARTALGTPVDIILKLPDGERLHLPGKVAHLGRDSDGDIGVRFDDLPAGTRQRIQSYIDELQAGRTPPPSRGTIPPGVLIKKKS
jgi:Tfp pilus assembly protein PilZ